MGSFEQKLTTFFKEHKRSKLWLVPKIVEAFEGKHEEAVLEHLNKRYNRTYTPLPPITETPTEEPEEFTEANEEEVVAANEAVEDSNMNKMDDESDSEEDDSGDDLTDDEDENKDN